MATFTFDETAGTTLESIDSKWEGDTTGLVTSGSGALRVSAAYAARNVRYENAQGDYQKSTASMKGFTSSTGQEYFALAVNKTGGSNTGYELFVNTGSIVALLRNGSYISDWSSTNVFMSDFTASIETSDAGGGSKYVKLFVNGIERISYTDASPLTTGYPGFLMYCGDNGVSANEMFEWTDGVVQIIGPPKSLGLLLRACG